MAGLTAYLGRIVNPISPDKVEDIEEGAILVDKNGIILDYGERQLASKKEGIEKIDFGSSLIIPGLIDLHTHLPQINMPIYEAEDLWTWLTKYAYKAEIDHARSSKRSYSRNFFDLCKKNGTTTTCVNLSVDFESADIAFEEARASKLRVVMGKTMMDREVPSELLENTRDSLGESEKLCKKWHERARRRIIYSFIPRSASCCSSELLRGVSKLAKKYNAYIQTHMSESLDENSWAKNLHPNFTTYARFYNDHGILGKKTIAAHAIHLTKADLRLIGTTGTSIAHCPSSNLLLNCGIMDVRERMLYGIPIGLGSDVGGGPTISLLYEMRMACFASRARSLLHSASHHKLGSVDSKLAFYLATLGSAKALGMSKTIGSFGRGKDADFVILDGTEMASVKNDGAIVREIVYRINPCSILATFVKGEQVYDRKTGGKC